MAKDVVSKILSESGAFQNTRLQEIVQESKRCLHFNIEDETCFLDLIWHYTWMSKILTPPTWWGGGKLYPLSDVVNRFEDLNLNFSDLANEKVDGDYEGLWFRPCKEIDENFDYNRFGPLVLQIASTAQKRECPASSFVIVDGIHRSLVLANKLKKKELDFQPLDAILLC